MANPKNKSRSTTGTIQVFRDALLRIIYNNIRYNNADGVIINVDEVNFSATVKINKTEYYKVPLRVLLSSQASFIEIPKVGTNCVVIFRDMNNSRPYILEVHESSKILMKIGSIVYTMTDKGISIVNGSYGLKKTLSDLIDAIGQLTVTTGIGPSGTPINITTFQNIKTDLNNYLI